MAISDFLTPEQANLLLDQQFSSPQGIARLNPLAFKYQNAIYPYEDFIGAYSQIDPNAPMYEDFSKPQPDFINAPQDDYASLYSLPAIQKDFRDYSFQDFYNYNTRDEYDPEKNDYDQVQKIQGPEPRGIGKLMEVLGNIPTPLNLLRKMLSNVGPGFVGPKGSRAYGDESLFSTFGRSRTGAEFFQNIRDRKARQEAAARGAAKQADQARIDAFRAIRDSQPSGGGGGGGIGSSYGGAASPGSKGPGGSDEMGSF